MQKVKSIFFLFIMVLLLAPWSLLDFCITHPLGHEHHHDPGKPTLCEQRKQYKGEAPVFWPPMECYEFAVNADDYRAPDKLQVKPLSQTLIIAAVLLDMIRLDDREGPFLPPPDPRCRSAPLLSSRQLRAPPII